jgi:hypothetical protein
MINCDFKVDLFGHRMTEVFKGFGRGGAVAVGSATRGSDRLSLPASEPASSASTANHLSRAADRSAFPAFTNLRRGR